jgi:hypothetical protein
MDEKDLFLRTLDDLHRSINSSDPYDVLRASALIRQLFLDGGNSLVDIINRHYRYRLQFEVVEQVPPQLAGLTPHIWCAIDGIDPRRVPTHLPRVEKSRDGFFSTTVATVDNHEYSIRELVQFVSHIMGGVHSGSVRTEKEQKLSQLQSLYVFSHLPVALMFIRSIGRLILETLKPLAYEVRDLSRFEDCSGISIHLVLALFPTVDEDNYILDIGTEKRRQRVSVFLDSRSELSLRLFDADGHRHIVRAGMSDCAYRYREPTYLNLQVAVREKELFLGIEAGGWFYYHVAADTSSDPSGDQFHFVLGSDVTGTKETHMAVMEQCVYSRILKKDEQGTIRKYFEDRIAKGYEARVHFEGNQFLYSQGHPNFPERPDGT